MNEYLYIICEWNKIKYLLWMNMVSCIVYWHKFNLIIFFYEWYIFGVNNWMKCLIKFNRYAHFETGTCGETISMIRRIIFNELINNFNNNIED